MSQFHSLVIKDIRKETRECVSVAFDVPKELKDRFIFDPGQNITLRFDIEGEELRRSYSICSSPHENELRVAIKKVPEGKFSSYANHQFKIGDTIEVMPPSGRFGIRSNHHTLPLEERTHRRDASQSSLYATDGGNSHKNYLAFAAGSGITPIISIIKSVLVSEPNSNFILVYGNRHRGDIIFREQLEALKNKFMNRFIIHHILSREKTEAPINQGRIDAEKCEQLSGRLIDFHKMDHIFLCGPGQMIFSLRDWLDSRHILPDKIHFELFTVPGQKTIKPKTASERTSANKSSVTIRLDGNSFEFKLAYEGRPILDGALDRGVDLPFACKGGVCATCKAKLISGEVEMETNYALEEEELKAGFILTCQSHPKTPEVFIDFDAR